MTKLSPWATRTPTRGECWVTVKGNQIERRPFFGGNLTSQRLLPLWNQKVRWGPSDPHPREQETGCSSHTWRVFRHILCYLHSLLFTWKGSAANIKGCARCKPALSSHERLGKTVRPREERLFSEDLYFSMPLPVNPHPWREGNEASCWAHWQSQPSWGYMAGTQLELGSSSFSKPGLLNRSECRTLSSSVVTANH